MDVQYVGAPSATGRFVIRDVTVVDPVDGSTSARQEIEIVDGTIASVRATGSTEGIPVIAGNRAFAVPGYVDGHAHPLNHPDDVAASYALMLANGVVGFRQMSGSPTLLRARAEDQLPAPRGAPQLLATPGSLLTPLNSATPEAAVAEVRSQKEQGADFIKAGMTSREVFRAVLAEANRLGIPLAGHLPGDLDPREASSGGMRCIEHLGPGVTVFAAACSCEAEIRSHPPRTIRLPSLKIPGMARVLDFVLARIVVNPSVTMSPSDASDLRLAGASYDEELAGELAAMFVASQTWHCPTLIRSHTQQFADQPEHTDDPRLRYIAPAEVKRWRRTTKKFAKLPETTRRSLREHWPTQLRLTKLFAEAGVPMLAGTDANGAGWIIPGFGLHDEFDLMASAGLSPLQILQTTTSAPARFLGREAIAGRVAPGYVADLVLLGSDPLVDHRALSDINAVVRAGHLWSRADLDAALARVEHNPTTR